MGSIVRNKMHTYSGNEYVCIALPHTVAVLKMRGK